MQDNAPIHEAQKVKKFFEENRISTIKWLPYSADLNQVEHACARLKEIIYN
jgi:transposase